MAVSPGINNLAELTQSLVTELGVFRDFVLTLQTEQDALVQGDVEHLVELARVKSEKVVLLSQLAERRNRFLVSQGCDPAQQGMEKWLQRQAAQEPGAAKLWQELLEQARHAQHLNQTNGIMIDTRLKHNQQALAVLKAAANQGSSLYGPDGQTHSLGMGRPLGKV